MADQPNVINTLLNPLQVQSYERYLPTAFDEGMTLLEKVNKIIVYLNQVGKLSNDVLDQWNQVMTWVMADGLDAAIDAKLDAMQQDGTLTALIAAFAGVGDMLKSVYDSNNDGIVDRAHLADNVDWTGITNIPSSVTSPTPADTTSKSNLDTRWINIMYPPSPLVGAKVDSVTDDFAAIQAIANYLGTFGGGTMFFPRGTALISQPLLLPDGVGIMGESVPASQIGPTTSFAGDFLIKSKDMSGHHHYRISNIYLQMYNKPSVGGIWLSSPYDYTTIENVVGNMFQNTFLKIGNISNSDVSQTIKVDSCIVYGIAGRTNPLLVVENSQENIFINNKFLGAQADTAPVASFNCVTHQEIIGNSFGMCNGLGLEMKADITNYRLSGNRIVHNLFENIAGANSISIIGQPGSAGEGDNNFICGNHYLNSTRQIHLDNVVGTQVIGMEYKLDQGSGARRNYLLANYHSATARNSTGNAVLSFDGTDIKAVEGSSLASQWFKFTTDDRSDSYLFHWNATAGSDLGLNLDNNAGQNMVIFQPSGNMQLTQNGTGILLKTPDGSKTYKISVDNSGAIVATLQ